MFAFRNSEFLYEISFDYVLLVVCSCCCLSEDWREEVLGGPGTGVAADDAPEPMDLVKEKPRVAEAVSAAFAG